MVAAAHSSRHHTVAGVKHLGRKKRLGAQRLEQGDDVCRAEQRGRDEKYQKIEPGNILLRLICFCFFFLFFVSFFFWLMMFYLFLRQSLAV